MELGSKKAAGHPTVDPLLQGRNRLRLPEK